MTVDWDALIAFATAHPTQPHVDAALARALLQTLPSSEAAVIDRRPVVVASVIDAIENTLASADLAIVGCDVHALDAVQAAALLEDAEAIARRGPRRRLTVDVPPALEPALGAALRASGYAVAFRSYELEAPVRAAGDAAGGFRDVRPDDVPALHALVSRAFRAVPGANVADLDSFARLLAGLTATTRVLFLDGVLAAWVRVFVEGRVAVLQSLGRDDRFARRGLGDRIVAEGLRVAAARGAEVCRLEVAAVNTRALALYERHGFREVARRAAYVREL